MFLYMFQVFICVNLRSLHVQLLQSILAHQTSVKLSIRMSSILPNLLQPLYYGLLYNVYWCVINMGHGIINDNSQCLIGMSDSVSCVVSPQLMSYISQAVHGQLQVIWLNFLSLCMLSHHWTSLIKTSTRQPQTVKQQIELNVISTLVLEGLHCNPLQLRQ